MSVRMLWVFLLGMACGAAAVVYLSPSWSASLLLNGGPVRAADTVVAQAPVRLPAVAPQVVSVAGVAILPPAPPESAGRRAIPMPAITSTELPSAPHSTAPPPAVPAGLAGPQPSAVNGLLIPVVGVKPGDLVDTFSQARGEGRTHDAIDIMAARGTPVVAANDGHVVKLFTSVPGGLTVYEFDPQGEVIYYYAHLDSYAPGLAEGQLLHRGDPIGFVGSTGDASASAPHLHFAVELLGPEKQWWHATSINPYGRFEGQ